MDTHVTICNKQCFYKKMVIFTVFTLKDLSLIMNLTKFFAWKNIKTCLRGKIEGLNKEADYYWAYPTSSFSQDSPAF